MSLISKNLKLVLDRINLAALQKKECFWKPRLVAVSKFKTEEDIIEAYEAGQRHFGENYVQELVQKAQSHKIIKKCPDIKWHFIGKLQSKKCNKLINLPNLFVIETVDSIELANKLNDICIRSKNNIMNIMIQVNTSGETQKNGIDPSLTVETYKQIKNNLRNLNVLGLMTIGGLIESLNNEYANKDFQILKDCKYKISEEIGIEPSEIELSMGMSNDFEKAIIMGSTSVRVGSLIFGERKLKSEI